MAELLTTGAAKPGDLALLIGYGAGLSYRRPGGANAEGLSARRSALARDQPPDDVQLVPGARIANGRYRLLIFHGGVPPLQFWQRLTQRWTARWR